MNWSGQQLKALHQALLSAYPVEAKLQRMLRIEMDLQLNAVAGGESYGDKLFSLIQAMKAEGRLPELLASAYRKNPGNPKLQALGSQPQDSG